MTYILGLNAYHGDAAACLVKDGKLIAAAEEERFRRVKHWAGFPSEAIRYCLDEAQIGIRNVDYVAVNRNPKANLVQKALFAFKNHPSLNLIKDRFRNASRVRDIRATSVGGIRQGSFEFEGRGASRGTPHCPPLKRFLCMSI